MLIGKWNASIINLFSFGWTIVSDKNFYETKCFKMLAQDPNDEIVD